MTQLPLVVALLAQVNASDRAALIAGGVVAIIGLIAMLVQMRGSFTQGSGDGHH